MDEIEVWKLVACLAIFASGFVGCGLTPLIAYIRGRRATQSVEPVNLERNEKTHAVVASRFQAPSYGAASNVDERIATAGVPSERSEVTFDRVVVFVERFVTSIGCGVMLTTGLVHVLPDSEDDIASTNWMESGYPLAPVICLGGIMLTYIFHMEVHFLVDGATQPVARMHMLEAGLVVHSVLIGFAVGVSDELLGLRGLTIALIFHQLCEGFAIGSVVGKAALKSVVTNANGDSVVIHGVSVLHQAVMVLLFALSTPAGVLIGWFAVASSTSADSVASHGAQGILSAVAAGILICSALSDFMPSMYGTSHHQHGAATDNHDRAPHEPDSGVVALLALDPSRTLPRMVLHLGVLIGCAAMSVLAVWS
jgi:solute carrier family 39 (zinc transporter), member 1/2/3